MSARNAVLPIELTSMASGDIAAGFTAINADGLDESCHIIRFCNDTDTDVTISYDGVTNHEYLKTGNSLLIYAMFAKARAAFRKGSVMYAKGTAGQSGNLYLSGYYQEID